MSALTDEQKKRIEDNRRRALALRQLKQQSKNCPDITSKSQPSKNNPVKVTCFPPSATIVRPPNLAATGLAVSSVTKPSTLQPTSTLFMPSNAGPIGNPKVSIAACSINKTSATSVNTNVADSHSGKYNAKSSQLTLSLSGSESDSQTKISFGGAKVKGKCLLVSRERFVIDAGYSPPLVTVCKDFKSKQYDPTTKKWSFALAEYNKIVSKIREIADMVTIEPLPKSVLVAFETQTRGGGSTRHIPEANLSIVDDKLVSTLMPFQRQGVNFCIWRGGRVLLADDMGLGKTIQALCVAAYYRAEWPLLIVVPSSVRFAWREQILAWMPSIDPQEINVVTSGKDSCSSGLVTILSYDLLARRQKDLAAKNFKVIIMDESHFLKNNKTARTQAAFPMLKRASRVILLSGTPALSRPSELFMQLTIVDSRCFPKFHDFGVRYCDGKQQHFGWDFSGSSNLEELQIVLEERVMIRRMKKDVVSQLPAKVRQMVLLDPGSVKASKRLKDSHKLVDKAKGSDRRGALLEYFHETASAKIPAVREYILDQLEADRKFLVFAHHKEVLDAIEEAVKAKKYGYMRIDGRTSSEQRNVLTNRFQTCDDVRIAILSITAANAGLNLTAASMVVFAELFWNPGILVQAEDRAHRIGQLDSVSVQYLVATGTADDFVWPLVQQKLEVLGKAGLSKDDFSEADTKTLKDQKQKDIMSYFEESFLEEDFDVAVEAGATATGRCSTESGRPGLTTAATQKGSLLNYLAKAETVSTRGAIATDSCIQATNENASSEMLNSDWLDEDFWADDDPDAPWPKKQRLS